MRTLNLTHVFISAALLVAATACGNELSTDNSTSTTKAADSTFSTQSTAGTAETKPADATSGGAEATTSVPAPPDPATSSSGTSSTSSPGGSSTGSSTSTTWNNTTTTTAWTTTTRSPWDTTPIQPTITSFSVSGGNVCDPTTGEPTERHPVIAKWTTQDAASVYVAIQNPDGPYEQNLPSSGSLELPQACPGDQIYYLVATNGSMRAMQSATLG